MPDLNALVQDALAGLIAPGDSAAKQTLYGDINRTAGNQSRQALENVFGRGLGISSVSRDILGEIERARADAISKAQLSALGQAATVAQENLNRGQAANQFGQSLALQKKGLGQQRDIANQNLLATGLGLGVGGLAQVGGKTFGPEITGGLRRLFGLGSDRGPISPMGGRETMAPMQSVESMPSFSGGGLMDAGLPSLSALSEDIDFGGGGGFDFGSLSGGLDTSFMLPEFDLSSLLLPDLLAL